VAILDFDDGAHPIKFPKGCQHPAGRQILGRCLIGRVDRLPANLAQLGYRGAGFFFDNPGGVAGLTCSYAALNHPPI
jgi:hypothetical protein